MYGGSRYRPCQEVILAGAECRKAHECPVNRIRKQAYGQLAEDKRLYAPVPLEEVGQRHKSGDDNQRQHDIEHFHERIPGGLHLLLTHVPQPFQRARFPRTSRCTKVS